MDALKVVMRLANECIGWGLLPPFKTKTIAPNICIVATTQKGINIDNYPAY